MRIVTIGDVGVVDDMIHIGDEAMFDEFAAQLRARGASITGVSSTPAETASRYGIEAVPALDFSPATTGGRVGQLERRRRVLAAADGDRSALPASDTAWQAIEAIRASDAFAVAGGGNMASLWPMHVFERSTLAELARRAGKPYVVTGQTIGPVLDGDDRALVAELLSGAELVGLRERASFELVRTLGVPESRLTATIDDASFVGVETDAAAPAAGTAAAAPAAPYCAVSLSAHVGAADRTLFAEAVARLLDRVVDETGLEVVFLAHWASLRADDERGDSLLHRAVIDRMTRPARVEPTTDTPAAARFAREAALHLTSRYHPAVFAVAAGVPTVGIAVDDYTTVKLTGALANFGQSSVVSAEQVLAGSADQVVLDAWGARDAVRTAWEARVDSARTASAAWWDRVAAALRA
ncbi:polysaccharide pyruvyl transferase family protein [Frigoribacterium sp. CFBP9030]|uniref:polysaccharide pyruvyl transferase family protein n=1 Tax=Frigoribacterium sp. CFBP9030 TaxID=3096537 RepID=UPI002A6AC2CE|nr:polysaccharide pyruvyl transferase family protein [Frigoribacterium sp. CFBP9030]MDY0891445.1 polysaccharide pyruvyl transferase family protein [Frigoribacterium sp. CFBP9030]